MKNTIGIWLTGCATLLFAACGGGSHSLGLMDRDEEVAMEVMTNSAPEAQSYVAGKAQSIEEVTEDQTHLSGKRIIRDGHIDIRVDELAAAKRQVDSLVWSMNAYYASESFYEHSREESYQLRIRIPSSNFDRFITELESGGGKVFNKNLYTRDVTEEFMDIELRLANKRNYLNRYRELVAQAKSMKDMLEIEEEIRGLEEEIESAEGRLRLLSDQIAYSTLNLSLTMHTDYKFTPSPQKKFFERVKKAVNGGWRGIVSFVVVLFYLWPLIIVAGVVLFVLFRAKKKNRRKTPGVKS